MKYVEEYLSLAKYSIAASLTFVNLFLNLPLNHLKSYYGMTTL